MKPVRRLATLMVLVPALGAAGCATHTGEGALIGGAGGALAGAAIGSHSHARAGAGALVGGTIGAIGGAIVGNEMDRQDRARNYGYRYEPGGYDDDAYYAEQRSSRPPYRRTVRYYQDDCAPRYRYAYRSYDHGGRYDRSPY
jgi:hypothetical protein